MAQQLNEACSPQSPLELERHEGVAVLERAVVSDMKRATCPVVTGSPLGITGRACAVIQPTKPGAGKLFILTRCKCLRHRGL